MEPVLRGHVKILDDGRTVWDGRWGMTLAAFEEENAELLNVFRYTCANRTNFQIGDSISFRGYFEVSSVAKGSKSQFTDKQLDMEVVADENEGSLRTIKGHGSNRFGNFDIKGTFNPLSGVLEVRRIYAPKPVQAPRSSRKQTAAIVGAPSSDIAQQVSTPIGKPKVSAQPQSPSSPAEVLSTSSSSSTMKSNSSQVRHDAQPQQPDQVLLPKLPIDTTFYGDARAVLRELKSRDLNKWFSSPVDAEALGLKDYHGIVKIPMDLGTIQEKLDSKRYATWEDCLGDMRLTFVNALRYNNRYSTVYKAASDLNEFLEERIARIGGKGKISLDNLAGSVGKRAHKKKKFFEPGDHDTATAVVSVVKKTPKSTHKILANAAMTHSTTTTLSSSKKSKKLNFSKVKRIKMSSSLEILGDDSFVAESISALTESGKLEPIVDDPEEGVDSFDELDEKDVFMTPPPSDDEGEDGEPQHSIDDTPLSTIPLIPDYNGYGTMSPTNLGDADDF